MNGVPHPGRIAVSASHQSGARRGAGWAYVELAEPDRFVVQLIQVWRLDHGISIARKISVARVVHEHKNHVGLFLPRTCSQRVANRSVGKLARNHPKNRTP